MFCISAFIITDLLRRPVCSLRFSSGSSKTIYSTFGCHRMITRIFNSFVTEALPYKNQSIDLQSKATDLFLYDRELRHESVQEQNNC